MTKTIDITRQKFGKLTAINLHHIKKTNKGTRHYWLCRCECGNEVIVRKDHLTSYKVRSCGCLNKEQLNSIRHLTVKHNHRKHRLYHIWISLKGRCYNKSNTKYKNYGERGVRVCDEWINNFAAFYDWSIENGYDENAKYGECTIERIDVNGNYEPSNCKWANEQEQANNRTTNCNITYNNETHTLAEWARIAKIKYATLYMRYKRGWSFEKCLQ